MRYPFTLLLGAVAFCMAAEPAEPAKVDSTKTFIFTDVINLPTTSVKDQNKSGTCWSFSGTSFMEDEIRHNGGDSLDLSEMYTVRQCYLDKARQYVRMYGNTNFGAGGSAMDVPYVWEKYGAMPEEVYSGLNYGEAKHVHGELDAVLLAYVKEIVKKPNGKLSTAWEKGLEGILDAYLGEVPETFEYQGKTYTPKSFAESQPVKVSDYVPVTSFSHHPYYEAFAIEVPDNWLGEKYYNVPLEEMKEIVDMSLEKGHTVVWAADVSERGFKWAKGVALMPKVKEEKDLSGTELSRWVKLSDTERANDAYNFEGPVAEIEVTSEMRQKMYDNQETTDDHGMEIVGTAVDQFGNKYYKVKNSWDTNHVYGGYFYVSEPYFLSKTVDILVHRDAVSKEIAKKLGLK